MKRTLTILICAGAALVLAWGGFVALVVMTNARNTTLADRVSSLELEIKKIAHARSLKSLVADTKDERDALALRLIKADAVVGFIKEVESLGRISGTKLTIDSVEIKPRTEGETAGSIELLSVSLSATGSWASVMQLVALVEALPAGAHIDRLSFSLAQKATGRSAAVWSTSMQFAVAKEKTLE